MLSKDLVAASSKTIVLSILTLHESYGYEIIKSVKDYSLNQIEWKDGMLYPVLKKLCNEGFAESYWKEVDGRRRKYYRITTKGEEFLKDEKEQWRVVNNTLDNLWRNGICFN